MILFFDMDDTLYQRNVPFMEAYELFFGKSEPELALRAYDTCAVRSNEVFEDSQTGKITMEEMYIYRYKNGFADVGIDISDEGALTFQQLYGERQKVIHPSACMIQILDYCKAHADKLGMITNGPARHQRNKMASLGMNAWTDDDFIFISGEIGITKPNPLIYEMAEAAAKKSADHLWMIGDNYSVDLETAIGRGWNTIWLNRGGKPVPEGSPSPSRTVKTEEELFSALRAIL